MTHNFIARLGILALVITLTACGTTTATSPTIPTSTLQPAATAARNIVIGDISDKPSKKIQQIQPLADYLALKLAPFGVGAGTIKIAPDMPTMVRWLKSGEVDIYFDSPYPAMVISDQSGAQPILRRWKDGVAEYNSIVFVRNDSGIASVTELKGHMLGMEDAYSTSGYLLPSAYLLEAGLKIAEQAGTDAKIPSDRVGYVFTGDDENTVQWVLSGKIKAGAVDHQLFRSLPEATRQTLTTLAETETIARQITLVRPDLEPSFQQAIKTILLEMDKTGDGQKILQTFEKTARFDDFPAKTSLDRMRQMVRLVQGE